MGQMSKIACLSLFYFLETPTILENHRYNLVNFCGSNFAFDIFGLTTSCAPLNDTTILNIDNSYFNSGMELCL